MFTSWFQVCIILSVYVVTTYIAGSEYPLSCPGGWFGVDCMFRCHCQYRSSCNAEGDCGPRKECEKGYFGPGCQYVDLIHLYGKRSFPQFLGDHDDSTCNPMSNLSQIEIYLTGNYTFTWFRVVVNQNRSGLTFSPRVNFRLVCDNEKKLEVSPTIVDYVCDYPEPVYKLTLFGILRNICTININGGRDVAVRQDAIQSSEQTDTLDAGSPGNVVINVNSSRSNYCSRTRSELNPYWQLTYNWPQVLTRIVVITRNDRILHLNRFNVSIYDDTSTIETFQVDHPIPANAAKEYTFLRNSSLPVYRLRITKLSNSALRLCNVQTYGETVCPDDTWGLACEHDCNCRVNESCSVVTGMCGSPCPNGTYGYRCLLPCRQTCPSGRCLERSGYCAKVVCLRGKFGPNCLRTCPQNCKDKLCHRVSGHCAECVDGFFGPTCSMACPTLCTTCDKRLGDCPKCPQGSQNCGVCPAGKYGSSCNMTCSSHCKDSKCHATNGTCLACNAGFSLPNCTAVTGCATGSYGKLCTETCPSGCKDEICDADTGVCTECEEGYYGVNCAHRCSILCVDNTCNTTSGACLDCLNGQVPNCSDCPQGKYGKSCLFDCPSLCKDRICKVNLGHCLACQGDQKPPFCEEETSPFNLLSYNLSTILIWLGVMLFLLLVAIILLSLCMRKSPTNLGEEGKTKKEGSESAEEESGASSEISVHESVSETETAV